MDRNDLPEVARQLAETQAEVASWIKDCQEYFPQAKGLHDIYRGIEKLQDRNTWLNERLYYAEFVDAQGKRAALQPADDGFYDADSHGVYFSFIEFVDSMRSKK